MTVQKKQWLNIQLKLFLRKVADQSIKSCRLFGQWLVLIVWRIIEFLVKHLAVSHVLPSTRADHTLVRNHPGDVIADNIIRWIR